MISVLKCPKCGGEADLKDLDMEKSLWKCRYCDSVNTMPQNLDKVGNLYNMANYYRQSNHFDDAVHVYQEILKENSSDAEAYFGLAISSYGIEYVEDPASGSRIPTCHRTKEESILNDPNYQLSLKYADLSSREIYRQEAEKIDGIMQKILRLSKEEADYDIFISYKETDESGERTPVSVYAQEIYEQLVKKGYKVFFARKSLEEMLGKEYEPIIFSALKSAKIMIVAGTSKENFEAVWVKNEWSRFLELRKADPGKTVIPCYRNVSPYELPSELSRFQSQDMGKIGFLQDLCDGIEKLMHVDRLKETVVSGDVERLLQNAGTFIKLNDTQKAVDIYEDLTNNYPEDYRAWWELARIYSEDFQNCYGCTEREYLKIRRLMQNGIALCPRKQKESLERVLEEYEKIYETLAKDSDTMNLTEEQRKRGIQYLLRKGFESLGKGNSKESAERFKQCLELDHSTGEAYWGLLLIKRGCSNEEQLVEQLKCIDEEEYYIKACGTIDKRAKTHYQEVAGRIRKNCEERRAKLVGEFRKKEQEIQNEIDKVENKIKELQEQIQKSKEQKKQISDKENRRILIILILFGIVATVVLFYASEGTGMSLMLSLICLGAATIYGLSGKNEEEIERENKALDKSKNELQKLLEEKGQLQAKFPFFPSKLIDEMCIPQK
ncbi:MAG: TIR domain-containing protein [Massilistercora timonensis]